LDSTERGGPDAAGSYQVSDPTPEEMEKAKGWLEAFIGPMEPVRACWPGLAELLHSHAEEAEARGRQAKADAVYQQGLMKGRQEVEEAVTARDREWTDALLGITKATITPGEADERVSRHYRDKISEAVKAATDDLRVKLETCRGAHDAMSEDYEEERQAREKAEAETQLAMKEARQWRNETQLELEAREKAEKEVERLRRQNHESGAKRDAALRHREQKVEMFEGLQKYAREQHAKDMERQGKPPWSEITGFSARVAAEIINQRDAALAEVERLRADELAWIRTAMDLRKRVEDLEQERDEVAAGVRTGAVDVAALCEQARQEGREESAARIAELEAAIDNTHTQLVPHVMAQARREGRDEAVANADALLTTIEEQRDRIAELEALHRILDRGAEQARREGAEEMREQVARWLEEDARGWRAQHGRAANQPASANERLAGRIRALPIDPPKAEPSEELFEQMRADANLRPAMPKPVPYGFGSPFGVVFAARGKPIPRPPHYPDPPKAQYNPNRHAPTCPYHSREAARGDSSADCNCLEEEKPKEAHEFVKEFNPAGVAMCVDCGKPEADHQ
jgi:hypothetical protein